MKENYFKIADQELRKKIKSIYDKDSGTYILHWFKNAKSRYICRLINTDMNGILYIGRGDTLYERVSSLANSIRINSDSLQTEPQLGGHEALSQKFFRIRKHIDIYDLFVEVRKCIKSPKEDESKLLEKYVRDFGELPPLNGSYGEYADWNLF